jgi:hypothetical protein
MRYRFRCAMGFVWCRSVGFFTDVVYMVEGTDCRSRCCVYILVSTIGVEGEVRFLVLYHSCCLVRGYVMKTTLMRDR